MRHGLRNGLLVLGLVIGSVTSATAQVSIGIGLPGVSIGINLPVYPQLVPVPGYPVYYAPQVNSNYFFYDGMYWVYQSDNWYASSWYNGPWGLVAPTAVPLYVLRVPVRYYRQPPPYFRGWHANAPPRWGDHWGNEWKQSRGDWDHWDRRAAPPRAPLPTYQRQYSGNRYPPAEQQPVLQGQKYKYQPHDPVVQQHYQSQRTQGAPATIRSTADRTLSARIRHSREHPVTTSRHLNQWVRTEDLKAKGQRRSPAKGKTRAAARADSRAARTRSNAWIPMTLFR